MHFDTVVFPGQGAQRLGMGKDFIENFPEAARVFELADATLPFDVYAICQRDESKLNLTEYTQPCIMTSEIAMYNALVAHYNLQPRYFAGHSLGEYTALVAAGVIPLATALRIVHKRGALMQQAATEKIGGMVAIIVDDIPYKKIQLVADQHEIDIANDNSNSQLVLSGKNEPLQALLDELKTMFSGQSFRAVYLNVSAPFHSRWMRVIEQTFREYLGQYQHEFNVEMLPAVVSNFLGGFYAASATELIDALAKQLSSPVKWRSNMNCLLEKSQRILEIGPNRPLRGFFKSMNVNITSIINVQGIAKMENINDKL